MAKQTFEARFDDLRRRVRRLMRANRYSAAKFLRNQGLTLEQAMVVMFGALPRHPKAQ